MTDLADSHWPPALPSMTLCSHLSPGREREDDDACDPLMILRGIQDSRKRANFERCECPKGGKQSGAASLRFAGRGCAVGEGCIDY